MSKQLIEQALSKIREQLDLSSETEYELLEEIRDHMEDAVAEARARGVGEQTAVSSVIKRFGLTDVAQQLQEVHAPWESADAVVACVMPVLSALILRWLVFAPDGTALNWQQLLVRPAFWIVALVALAVPFIQFRQWRYALVGWGVFWAITMMFILFPVVSQW